MTGKSLHQVSVSRRDASVIDAINSTALIRPISPICPICPIGLTSIPLRFSNKTIWKAKGLDILAMSIGDFLICFSFKISFPMQCVEHVAAQRIAILRVQKPENAPFLPSENRFFGPSRACVFVPAKLAIFRDIS